jgi:chitosanase
MRRTLLALASVAVLLAPGPAQAADRLLSQGRPAASSSAKAGYPAKVAFDGRHGTAWIGTAGSWLSVDLGAVRRLSRIYLSWGTAYARGYYLQASDDARSWRNLRRVSTGDGGVDYLTGLTGAGRYVRLVGTGPATRYGLSVYEFQVYGSALGASSSGANLDAPAVKDIAMRLVSSAENSSLNWRAQYGYIEDIGDGRGYTGGIVGFCSGTSDMLALVALYTARKPGNVLARYLPALRRVDGTASHAGLGSAYVAAWRKAAADPVFRKAQEDERDRAYFNPAVNRAKADGLQALGQFAYYDAAVMHGYEGMASVRAAAARRARTPALGGDEAAYLEAFLNARVAEMRTEEAHSDTSRVDTAQRVFLRAGNLTLRTPLHWRVYGDRYSIA